MHRNAKEAHSFPQSCLHAHERAEDEWCTWAQAHAAGERESAEAGSEDDEDAQPRLSVTRRFLAESDADELSTISAGILGV